MRDGGGSGPPSPQPRGRSWPWATEQPALGPCRQSGGGGARALRLGHPVCVPAPDPQPLSRLPGSRPSLPQARPLPPACKARVQPPSGRVITVSPPDQTAAGHRCRAVALSPDGLAGSSSFVSGGRHHGPRGGDGLEAPTAPACSSCEGHQEARLSAAARPGRPAAGPCHPAHRPCSTLPVPLLTPTHSPTPT